MLTKPMRASTTTTTGTSNASPNARNMDSTKSRYDSISGVAEMLLGAKP